MQCRNRWSASLFIVLLVAGCQKSATKDGGEPASATATVEPANGDDVTAAVPKVDAEQVLSGALAAAQSNDKNVFVHLGAPW